MKNFFRFLCFLSLTCILILDASAKDIRFGCDNPNHHRCFYSKLLKKHYYEDYRNRRKIDDCIFCYSEEVRHVEEYENGEQTKTVTYDCLDSSYRSIVKDCDKLEHNVFYGLHYLTVSKDSSSFIIRAKDDGYEVGNIKYDFLHSLGDNKYIIAKNDSKYGLITPYDQVCVPFIFDNIEIVSKILLKVEQNRRYGLIFDNGQILLPMEYNQIKLMKLFSSNYLSVKKNGHYGVVSGDGKILSEVKYRKVKQSGNKVYGSIDGKIWESLN